jgi:hypothetical protein
MMELVFDALFSQIKIDEKGGGYLLTLSIPESDRDQVGQLIAAGTQVFKCVLVSSAFVPQHAPENEP